MNRPTNSRFPDEGMDSSQSPRHSPSPVSGSAPGYGAPFQPPPSHGSGSRNSYQHRWHPGQPGAYHEPHAGQGGNNFRVPVFYEDEGDMRARSENQRFMPNHRYNPNPFLEGPHVGGPHNNFHHGLSHPNYYNPRGFANMPRNPNAHNGYGGPQMGYNSTPHDLGYHHNGPESPPPYDDQQGQTYDGADDPESEGNYHGSDPEWNEREGIQSDGGESEFVDNAEDDVEMEDGDDEKPNKLTYDYDIPAKYDTKFAGRIKSPEDYVREKDRRRRDDLKGKDGSEWNMPKDDPEMRAHVESLFKAIKNLKGIFDQPTASGHPAQAVARIRNGYYPDDYLERACWEILVSLQSNLRCYEPFADTSF